MIRPQVSLVAKGASIDRDSNLLSFFEVIEEADTQDLPKLSPPCVFVTTFEREEGDPEELNATFKVSIDGDVLTTHNFRFSFKGKLRARQVVRIAGLLLSRPGLVSFSLDLGQAKAEYSFPLKLHKKDVEPIVVEPKEIGLAPSIEAHALDQARD